MRCRLVPGAGGGGILLEFSGLTDAAPVTVAATLCFAAPPWGGDEYLTSSAAADAARSATGVEQMSGGVAVEADLAAALTAADVAFAAAGASPFDLDCGLRIHSEAGARLATALALPAAPAPASPGTVGGTILLAALVRVTAQCGMPLQLYLPRNCPRAALVALLAAFAAATAPSLPVPRQRECVRASLGGTAPTTATFEELFLDDRRDATALLVTLAAT